MEQHEVRILIELSWRVGVVLMRPGPVFILTFEAVLYRCPSSNLKGMYGLVGLPQRCQPSQVCLQLDIFTWMKVSARFFNLLHCIQCFWYLCYHLARRTVCTHAPPKSKIRLCTILINDTRTRLLCSRNHIFVTTSLKNNTNSQWAPAPQRPAQDTGCAKVCWGLCSIQQQDETGCTAGTVHRSICATYGLKGSDVSRSKVSLMWN